MTKNILPFERLWSGTDRGVFKSPGQPDIFVQHIRLRTQNRGEESFNHDFCEKSSFKSV